MVIPDSSVQYTVLIQRLYTYEHWVEKSPGDRFQPIDRMAKSGSKREMCIRKRWKEKLSSQVFAFCSFTRRIYCIYRCMKLTVFPKGPLFLPFPYMLLYIWNPFRCSTEVEFIRLGRKNRKGGELQLQAMPMEGQRGRKDEIGFPPSSSRPKSFLCPGLIYTYMCVQSWIYCIGRKT